MEQCDAEVQALWNCFYFLQDPETPRWAFPHLRTVAVASIYGFPDNYWQRWQKVQREGGANPEKMQHWAETLNTFCSYLDLEAFCIRDLAGPLASLVILGWTVGWPSVQPFPCLRTLHYEFDILSLYGQFGGKLRWACDLPSSEPRNLDNDTLAQTQTILKNQMTLQKGGFRRNRGPEEALDLEVYCSSAIPPDELYEEGPPVGSAPPQYKAEAALDLADCRGQLSQYAQAVQRKCREISKLPDKVRWYPSPETPVCLACGSGPPHWQVYVTGD